jgi:hypothetical protein
LRSLKFAPDLDDPLAFIQKSSYTTQIPIIEYSSLEVSNHVGVQTETEVEEDVGVFLKYKKISLFVVSFFRFEYECSIVQ